jgi:hypothetical protein
MSRMAHTGAAELWEPAKSGLGDTGPARGGVRLATNHMMNASGSALGNRGE